MSIFQHGLSGKQHVAPPHKLGLVLQGESDEQRQVVAQSSISQQAGVMQGDVERVACTPKHISQHQHCQFALLSSKECGIVSSRRMC